MRFACLGGIAKQANDKRQLRVDGRQAGGPQGVPTTAEDVDLSIGSLGGTVGDDREVKVHGFQPSGFSEDCRS